MPRQICSNESCGTFVKKNNFYATQYYSDGCYKDYVRSSRALFV